MKEVIIETTKYFELKNDKNTTYTSNLWNTANVALRWKIIDLKAFIRREKVKIRLRILFQKLEKEWQIRYKEKDKRKEIKLTN